MDYDTTQAVARELVSAYGCSRAREHGAVATLAHELMALTGVSRVTARRHIERARDGYESPYAGSRRRNPGYDDYRKAAEHIVARYAGETRTELIRRYIVATGAAHSTALRRIKAALTAKEETP